MTNLVEVDEIVVAYDRQNPVLRSVSANFAEGRTHVITGASGCGKSTLLSAIGLMVRTRSGTIRIAGIDCARSGDHRRAAIRAAHIGFVFQDALLEPSMTVWENVLEGVPATRSVRPFRHVAEESLERFGLIDLRKRAASKLSGGQAQRVSLVRAMLKAPTVLLADEPTGNLDDDTSRIVLDELFGFGCQAGHTTVIVTHDMRIASRADSVLELGANR